jgi:predicted nuclease of predicted toxin-antitoxin system
MRFLIDNALSPAVASALSAAGHDAVHVRDRGLQTAPDTEVIALAAAEDRIVVSADTDFGTLLSLRGAAKPSFILFRGEVERRPEHQVAALLGLLPELERSLASGAIVVISGTRVRIRNLPVRPD